MYVVREEQTVLEQKTQLDGLDSDKYKEKTADGQFSRGRRRMSRLGQARNWGKEKEGLACGLSNSWCLGSSKRS